MIRTLRAVIAFAGLLASPFYWEAAQTITQKSLDWPTGILPSVPEQRLRLLVGLVLSMALYGLAVSFWRRFDDRLRNRTSR